MQLNTGNIKEAFNESGATPTIFNTSDYNSFRYIIYNLVIMARNFNYDGVENYNIQKDMWQFAKNAEHVRDKAQLAEYSKLAKIILKQKNNTESLLEPKNQQILFNAIYKLAGMLSTDYNEGKKYVIEKAAKGDFDKSNMSEETINAIQEMGKRELASFKRISTQDIANTIIYSFVWSVVQKNSKCLKKILEGDTSQINNLITYSVPEDFGDVESDNAYKTNSNIYGNSIVKLLFLHNLFRVKNNVNFNKPKKGISIEDLTSIDATRNRRSSGIASRAGKTVDIKGINTEDEIVGPVTMYTIKGDLVSAEARKFILDMNKELTQEAEKLQKSKFEISDPEVKDRLKKNNINLKGVKPGKIFVGLNKEDKDRSDNGKVPIFRVGSNNASETAILYFKTKEEADEVHNWVNRYIGYANNNYITLAKSLTKGDNSNFNTVITAMKSTRENILNTLAKALAKNQNVNTLKQNMNVLAKKSEDALIDYLITIGKIDKDSESLNDLEINGKPYPEENQKILYTNIEKLKINDIKNPNEKIKDILNAFLSKESFASKAKEALQVLMCPIDLYWPDTFSVVAKPIYGGIIEYPGTKTKKDAKTGKILSTGIPAGEIYWEGRMVGLDFEIDLTSASALAKASKEPTSKIFHGYIKSYVINYLIGENEYIRQTKAAPDIDYIGEQKGEQNQDENNN